MLVDCDRCSARALRCDTCVVGLLLGPPDGRLQIATVGAPATPTGPGAGPPTADPTAATGAGAAAMPEVGSVLHVDPRTARPGDFDTAERRALAALAGAGLIQPLGLTDVLEGVTNRVYPLTERHSLAG